MNSWIGTVGAVKNKTSLIGIGHLKVVYGYWLAMDFAGNLGMQETRMAQRKPRPVPSYYVRTTEIGKKAWLLPKLQPGRAR